jgi:flagellar motor switch protein FliG
MADDRERPREDLAPIDKAAILLLAMGDDEAAKVLKHLEPREVQRVGAAMSALGRVDTRQIDSVVDHFLEAVSSEAALAMGANDYLRKMLVGALGEQRARSVLERISGVMGGLDRLRWMHSRAIADFILHEHPKIQAVVLSYLEPAQAAEVLGSFPEDAARSDAVLRLASLESVPSGALRSLSLVLEQHVGRPKPGGAELGGKRAAALILNHLDKAVRESVTVDMRRQNRALCDEIQALRFVFDDLDRVQDRGFRALLRQVSTGILAVALKGADAPLREKVLRNLPDGGAALLQQDTGSVRVSEVQSARHEILSMACRLFDAGEIVLGGSGSERTP